MNLLSDFFSVWVFVYEHLRVAGLQRKEGGGISLTPHYYFHQLYRHFDVSRAIASESSPLHIASSRTRTGNLWLPNFRDAFSRILNTLVYRNTYFINTALWPLLGNFINIKNFLEEALRELILICLNYQHVSSYRKILFKMSTCD